MGKKTIKDVFGFWQIKSAELSGKYEIPVIHGTSKIPDDLVLFSNCGKEKHPENKAVHFYQFDENFINCLESEIKLSKKLKVFKRFQSVILPDYSIYRDMSLSRQIFQVYNSRAAGNFLMQNGIRVIPNIRWGDERTYEFAFSGIDKWGVIAIGVQGAYNDKENTESFENGFYKMLDVLKPETILCYGQISAGLTAECCYRHISVKTYQTEISKVEWSNKLFQNGLNFSASFADAELQKKTEVMPMSVKQKRI